MYQAYIRQAISKGLAGLRSDAAMHGPARQGGRSYEDLYDLAAKVIDVRQKRAGVSYPDNAAEMGRFSAFARQLGTITLGRRPLIAKHVGRWWLTIGRQEIDEAQSEKCALTQPDFGRCCRFVCHPLQKDRVG